MGLIRRARTQEEEEVRQEALNLFGPPWWTRTVLILGLGAGIMAGFWGDTPEVAEALKQAITPAALLVAAAITGLALVGARLDRNSPRNLVWNELTRIAVVAIRAGVVAIVSILIHVAVSATPLVALVFRFMAATFVVYALFSLVGIGSGLVDYLAKLRQDPEEPEAPLESPASI